MTTVSLHSEGDTTLDQFDSFMADLLWEKEVNINICIVVTSVYDKSWQRTVVKFLNARRREKAPTRFGPLGAN